MVAHWSMTVECLCVVTCCVLFSSSLLHSDFMFSPMNIWMPKSVLCRKPFPNVNVKAKIISIGGAQYSVNVIVCMSPSRHQYTFAYYRNKSARTRQSILSAQSFWKTTVWFLVSLCAKKLSNEKHEKIFRDTRTLSSPIRINIVGLSNAGRQ